MRRYMVCFGAALVVCAGAAQASINYSGGVYFQTFDSLSSSGANAWADNSTLPGWYAERAADTSGNTTRAAGPWSMVPSYTANDGSSNSGVIYSYGSSGSAERALGSVASGNAAGAEFVYALVLLNTSGLTYTDFTLSYVGEQWRNGGNTNAQMLDLDYRISPTFVISHLDGNNVSGYVNPTSLDFVSPTVGATASALDGNLAANQAFVSSTENVIWGPNEYLILRWWDNNDPGNDHGLSLDSMRFQATPEPASLALLGLGALALRRRR